jgi:hypothetical protein
MDYRKLKFYTQSNERCITEEFETKPPQLLTKFNTFASNSYLAIQILSFFWNSAQSNEHCLTEDENKPANRAQTRYIEADDRTTTSVTMSCLRIALISN